MPKPGEIEGDDPAAKPCAQLDPPLRGVEQSVQGDEGAFALPAPAPHTELTAVAEAKRLNGTQRPFAGSELLTWRERSYRPIHDTAAKARSLARRLRSASLLSSASLQFCSTSRSLAVIADSSS